MLNEDPVLAYKVGRSATQIALTFLAGFWIGCLVPAATHNSQPTAIIEGQ